MNVKELLEKVKSQITAEPATFSMDYWFEKNDCGTVCCIGGWMASFLKDQKPGLERVLEQEINSDFWFVDDALPFIFAFIEDEMPWLSEQDIKALFLPWQWGHFVDFDTHPDIEKVSKKPGWMITPQDACKVIDLWLDWAELSAPFE